jgi:hypothetical protein
MKREVALQAGKISEAALREVNIQDGIARIELELVVTGKPGGWLEEKFEDVVEPKIGVVLGFLRKKVSVLHLGEEVEVVPVPAKLGLGRREWLALGGIFIPRPLKRPYALGVLPSGIIALAVDCRREISPAANRGIACLDGNSTEE